MSKPRVERSGTLGRADLTSSKALDGRYPRSDGPEDLLVWKCFAPSGLVLSVTRFSQGLALGQAPRSTLMGLQICPLQGQQADTPLRHQPPSQIVQNPNWATDPQVPSRRPQATSHHTSLQIFTKQGEPARVTSHQRVRVKLTLGERNLSATELSIIREREYLG
jgi:hypothetical protein